MSFARQVYFAAILAGWAALAGWVVCEFAILPWSAGAAWEAIPSAGIVGAAIGAGVGLAAGLAGGGWQGTSIRAATGLLGGLLGGLIGGLAGQGLYRVGLPQWLCWTVIGVGIGGTDALYSRDSRRLRNGLLGGLLGGLVGGLLFRGLASALAGGTGMTARAVGFVAIGVAIGCMVGLVQVLLRNAWVTVVDGYGAGRQLLLAGHSTPLGKSPTSGLLLSGEGVIDDHAALIRTPGGYAVEDLGSPSGTLVNGRPALGQVPLTDGDMIKIGSTYLRFNTAERTDHQLADPVPQHLPPTPPPAAPPALHPPVAKSIPQPPIAKPAPQPPVAKPAPQPPATKPRLAPAVTRPVSVVPASVPISTRPNVQTTPVMPKGQPRGSAPLPAPAPVTPPVTNTPMTPGDICPECGVSISGKPGLRVCANCGAMS